MHLGTWPREGIRKKISKSDETLNPTSRGVGKKDQGEEGRKNAQAYSNTTPGDGFSYEPARLKAGGKRKIGMGERGKWERIAWVNKFWGTQRENRDTATG